MIRGKGEYSQIINFKSIIKISSKKMLQACRLHRSILTNFEEGKKHLSYTKSSKEYKKKYKLPDCFSQGLCTNLSLFLEWLITPTWLILKSEPSHNFLLLGWHPSEISTQLSLLTFLIYHHVAITAMAIFINFECCLINMYTTHWSFDSIWFYACKTLSI